MRTNQGSSFTDLISALFLENESARNACLWHQTKTANHGVFGGGDVSFFLYCLCGDRGTGCASETERLSASVKVSDDAADDQKTGDAADPHGTADKSGTFHLAEQ